MLVTLLWCCQRMAFPKPASTVLPVVCFFFVVVVVGVVFGLLCKKLNFIQIDIHAVNKLDVKYPSN